MSQSIGIARQAERMLVPNQNHVIGGGFQQRRDKDDGRVMRVTVMAKGQALDHLLSFFEQITTALLDGFSEAERALAFDLLARRKANATKALTLPSSDP